jgi:Domain of unknown function (DUF4398)
MPKSIIAGLAALLVATPAFAVSEDRAKRAFAAAQAKIDSAQQAGAAEHAAAELEQARRTLEEARRQVNDSDEDRAFHAANEAAAYADLALVMAQLHLAKSADPSL